MMRQLALIVLAVLWIAPAQAETKEGPDGFGPIKFGMTKEEAWAAIDGKGEWKSDHQLTYELEFSRQAPGRPDITVSQTFIEDRAAGAVINYLLDSGDYNNCIWTLSEVVSYIAYRYGTPPIHMETRPSESWKHSESQFVFIYDDGVSIFVLFRQFYPNGEDVMHCDINFIYNSAGMFEGLGEIPF